MKWLEKFQGRNLSEFATEVWWKEFESMNDEVFCRATVRSCEVFQPPRFPTISDIRNLMSHTRETDWRKEKQAPPVAQRSKMGKEAIALISRRWFDDAHPDKVNSYQLAVLMMVEMEEKYPGCGWEAKGKGLLNWLEQHEKNKEKTTEEIVDRTTEE